ncbi:hypothetical protein OBRU01_16746, partial [Operophtera brumata]
MVSVGSICTALELPSKKDHVMVSVGSICTALELPSKKDHVMVSVGSICTALELPSKKDHVMVSNCDPRSMFSRSRLFLTRALPLRGLLVPEYQNNASVFYSITAARSRSTTPLNTVVMFVPQQEAWVVERMGKFHRILEPGLNLLWPIVDKIKYVQSLKEIAIDVPKQSAITSDNVTLTSYGVEDPEFAITQLAQTTMRSELGQISLDKVFRERESLNIAMVEAINKASEAWGDIKLPSRVHEAMQMQVEAERKKRAAILESEGVRAADINVAEGKRQARILASGVRAADINVAEGKRQARILASEAEKMEQINKASGEANAMLAVAEARARGLALVGRALRDT